MKRGYAAPAAVLALMLALSLWNGWRITDCTRRWQGQLDRVEALARREDWSAAAEALEGSREDWQGMETYLRIACRHDAVDSVGEQYSRCAVYAEAGEESEFLAELAGLRERMENLAEMERLHMGNIL